jgi:hypothetical protein
LDQKFEIRSKEDVNIGRNSRGARLRASFHAERACRRKR